VCHPTELERSLKRSCEDKLAKYDNKIENLAKHSSKQSNTHCVQIIQNVTEKPYLKIGYID